MSHITAPNQTTKLELYCIDLRVSQQYAGDGPGLIFLATPVRARHSTVE